MHSVRHPHRVPFARHPERPHQELQVLAAGAVLTNVGSQADQLPETESGPDLVNALQWRWPVAIAIEHKLAVIVWTSLSGLPAQFWTESLTPAARFLWRRGQLLRRCVITSGRQSTGSRMCSGAPRKEQLSRQNLQAWNG